MKIVVLFSILGVNLFGAVIAGFEFSVPANMKLHQQAKSDETFIVGLAAADGGYVNLFARPLGQHFDPEGTFFNKVRVLRPPVRIPVGEIDWWMSDTSRIYSGWARKEISYSTVFFTEENGWLLLGNSRHSDRLKAQENANQVLSTVRRANRSLTGPSYKGKKYYLGLGAVNSWDPSMMHNEVKFDVNHTHNIFTQKFGGGYTGTTLIGPSAATRSAILDNWKRLGGLMTSSDMYVQYSSGHGNESGLGVGVTYKEVRDNALAYPAQEIIIFMMACYSGNLVDRFNEKKSVWEKWDEQGRTLMVFVSSLSDETSSTGPGTDPDEPNGPNGSAGSAFGFALWKALIGYADGFTDGFKDGFLSLDEIEKFTISKTKEVGGHQPVSTGNYIPGLIMNKVPPAELMRELDRTKSLSDEEILRKIQDLDAQMRVTGL